ncbi:DUF3108 domain-containing protein [Acidovorax sp. PRC11]|uniref:DUF3108 domain-containing protein n=1 Tax=Acidovorax sp. PRC11 TaxID=2962592 RepID=UPI002880C891|nr:DUF3108 domain-containing protein [Acidovorax sp. PRC11]MDT0139700.1 DUF3108 domain-containing protein [Acidovorax sp. PRC11]
MPRRALAALTVLVAALHALVLFGLPRWTGGPDAPRDERMAFHTRMLEPALPLPSPAPEAAEPAAPAAVAQPAPAPKRAAAPRPRPAPARKPAAPAPETAADSAPPPDASPSLPSATVAEPPADAAAMPAQASPAEGSPADDGTTPAAADSAAPPPSAGAVAAAPAPMASAPASAASSTAVAAAPAASASAPDDLRNAGVEIRPPNGPATDASAHPPPVQLPPSVRLTFEVSGEAKKFNYRASATLAWKRDGDHYEARQEIKAFLLGSRSQSSTGLVTPAGLQPQRFVDQARNAQTASLDFAAGRATFSGGNAPAAIAAGAQDRLSVFIQLGALLAAAPERYPDGTRITLTTVGARNADRWAFSIEGTEMLDLPIGPTPALKLQRLPRRDARDADQKAELWLAPSLGFLPARIRITQGNGDYADLQLSNKGNP